jgi:hypothetical protein
VIIVRVLAALVIVAAVLAVAFLWNRDSRYLTWAWRVFIAALAGIVGLMVFYFVDRLVSGP